ALTLKAITAGKPPIDEEDWLASLGEQKGQPAADMARRTLAWLRSEGFDVGVTQSQDAMYASLPRPDGKRAWPFFVRRSSGKLDTALQYLKETPAYASEESRQDLLNRIKAVPGQTISTVKTTGWPAVPLADLARPEVWNAVQEIAREIKA